MLQKIDSGEIILELACLIDEAAFHLNGIVNIHNCRIWVVSYLKKL
jgi:hypothetical protein